MIGTMNGRSILGNRSRSREQGANGRRVPGQPERVRFPDEVHVEREEESLLTTLWNFFVFSVASILASVCVAGFLTLLVVLYVTVKPFSQLAYRRLVAQLGCAAFLDAVALLLPNTKVFLTGDSDVPSQIGTQKIILRNEYLHINVHDMDNSSTPLRTSSSLVNTARAVTSARTENGTGSGSPSSIASTSSSDSSSKGYASPDVTILAKLLHLFLEFPLMNGEDYVSDREHLFQLLRSFAEDQGSCTPVHLLLYPEGWSLHHGADRLSIHAKSNEFAKREGRPQLRHLLLPRNRGFKASLECLRESSPVVYDVTMAHKGYDGSLPPSINLSLVSIWRGLVFQFPSEIHLRIKRYSMEEVLQDSSWLDKKWAEKDRLLSHFARNQSFPVENRGLRRPRIFDTRYYSMENSLLALVRLLLLPCAVPILILLSVPLFWTLLWIWLAHKTFRIIFNDPSASSGNGDRSAENGADEQTPGSMSAPVTPFCPTTPFVSPSVTAWLPEGRE